MACTQQEAEELLAAAYPWGAHVTHHSESEFVCMTYGVVTESILDDRAELFFVRELGKTTATASEDQIREAAVTGVLDLPRHLIRRPEATDMYLLARPIDDFVGPQSGSDSQWAARMRLHQSWWRAFRLRVPFGCGPNAGSTTPYGNMLDDDGDIRGLNFVTDDARAAYHERFAGSHAGVRTRRNLLASQPMAFNLFGHLCSHLELASVLFSTVLGEPVKVTSIEMEKLSDALGDKTAFDAFVRYQRQNGSPGFVAVETKLTELFSQTAYDWAKYLAHPLYRTDAFVTSDPAQLGDPKWSQLWRNHMLALAESARNPELGTPSVLVVHHSDDPQCQPNVAGYQRLLSARESVKAVDLARTLSVLGDGVVGDTEQEAWVADMRDRYVNLDLSAPLLNLPRVRP
jgi:hypothetical protein